MTPLRALVVDDEEPARRRICDLLEARDGWRIAGTCDNGQDAVDTILDSPPDLVFLDIQMPELTGFDVLRQVGAARMPPVIFVTAYDQYAIQAFESSALDYLLKPFADARFHDALRRCQERIRLLELEDVRTRMLGLLDVLHGGEERPPAAPTTGAATTPARIAVQSRDRTLLLPVDDIDYISADGPYMRLHVSDREFMIRERMHSLEKRLDPKRFVRIHRSTLVNIDRVVAIEPYFRGEAYVSLSSGGRLKVSRSRRAALYAIVGMADPDPS